MAAGEGDVGIETGIETGTDPGTDRTDPAAPGPADAPAPPPRLDTRLFRHELTPTWLATATALAGRRPPPTDRPLRAAWLGCRAPSTPAVVAAVHPEAEVWAWDPDPARVAAMAQLRDDAGLANLVVHEQPRPPAPSAAAFDLVVLDALIDSVEDRARHELVRSAATLLRPGGLACVTYRTVVGWSEIAPVVAVLRHVAHRSSRDHADSVADALALLRELDDRQAGYLATRPVVRAWLRELFDLPVADVVERYVHRDLRPVSHAQLVEAFAAFGVGYLGPGRLDPDLPADAGPGLVEQVRRAGSSVLRETFGDLAVRRSDRADLFGLGAEPADGERADRWLADLRVTSFQAPGGALLPTVAPATAADPALDALTTAADAGGRAVPVGELWPEADADERRHLLRRALARGVVHPIRPGPVCSTAAAAAARLTAVLDHPSVPGPQRCVVAPGLGGAVAADPPVPAARHALLGITAP